MGCLMTTVDTPPSRIPCGNNRDRGHQAHKAQLPSRRGRGREARHARAHSGQFATMQANGQCKH
eukprot:14269794-Alexandrium_andersonii.AAC.1